MRMLKLSGQNDQPLYISANNIASFYKFVTPDNEVIGSVIFMVSSDQGIAVKESPDDIVDQIIESLGPPKGA